MSASVISMHFATIESDLSAHQTPPKYHRGTTMSNLGLLEKSNGSIFDNSRFISAHRDLATVHLDADEVLDLEQTKLLEGAQKMVCKDLRQVERQCREMFQEWAHGHDVMGEVIITRALRTNTTVSVIDLSGNLMTNSGAILMSRVLLKNSTITELNLHFNKIGQSGAESIASSLTVNTTLTVLDLSENPLGPRGVKAISNALKINNSLRKISLKCTNAQIEGGIAIALALKMNAKLTYVDLQQNSLHDPAIMAIAGALKRNTSLLSLRINSQRSLGLDPTLNSFGPQAAKALCEAILLNSSLQHLDISYMHLTYNLVQDILEAACESRSMQWLHLAGNEVSTVCKRAIEHISRNNVLDIDMTNCKFIDANAITRGPSVC